MKIQRNFPTVQIAPEGVSRAPSVDCFIELSDFPGQGRYDSGHFLCLFGTDTTWIAEHATGWGTILVVCANSPKVEAMAKKARKEGKEVVVVDPKSVSESTLYALARGCGDVLWTQCGDGDVEEVAQPQKPKRKRARKSDGEFKADDPATPEVNEAWESGES